MEKFLLNCIKIIKAIKRNKEITKIKNRCISKDSLKN